MKRNLMVIMLIVTMLAGMLAISPVSAEEDLDKIKSVDWAMAYTGLANYTDCDFGTTTSESMLGSRSLYVNFEAANYSEQYFTMTGFNTTDAACDHTVTLYVKSEDVSGISVGFKSIFTPIADCSVEDAEKEGWKKYTFEYAASGTGNMQFALKFAGKTKAYIDGITVIQHPYETDKLNGAGNFETVETGTDLDSSIWWTQSAYPYNSVEKDMYTAKVTTDDAFEGKYSMHLTSPYIIMETGKAFVVRNLYATGKFVEGRKYNFSCYIKRNSYPSTGTSINLIGGGWGANSGMEHKPDKWTSDSATGKRGWFKYTKEFTAGANRIMQLQLQNTFDMYVDNVSVIDTVTGEELMIGGTFEENDVLPTELPNLTESAVNNQDWIVTPTLSKASVYNIATTAEKIFSGNRALKLEMFMKPEAIADSVTVTSTKLLSAGTYTCTAFVSEDSEVADLSLAVGANVYPFTGVTPETAEGWKKYTFNVEAAADTSLSLVMDGPVDAYIDDITLISGETDALGGTGNFEKASAGEYEVFGAKMYDADGKEISALSTEHSGATITTVADIVNYTRDGLTAQLIVCFYDGLELKNITMTDIATVAKASDASHLECEITLPQYNEVGKYNVKAFIWNNVNGMIPLSSVSNI